ncbi:MAG: ABC transporter ATP-binding protein [Planctomycetota bacterium]
MNHPTLKTDPILMVRDAEKSYGQVRALRGASFDLYPGELLGFLGPNGAGKTTMIRCLAGRAQLDSGTLTYNPDRIVGDELPGVVPQSLAIYNDLTALQNLRAFGRLHGLRGMHLDDRIVEALEWSNLTDRADQLAKTFSGGMKRRLNIACSVLHEPQILLLDEPTVGVDPQSRERIYEMLRELCARGTSILLTTHQLDEAQYRCDRIAIVDEGRVIHSGTFQQLLADTVGQHQQLNVQFASRLAIAPPGFQLSATGETATATLSQSANELSEVMRSVESCGQPVRSIKLESPKLQHVFLHLTGRELRE